jgi:hypothetical protein
MENSLHVTNHRQRHGSINKLITPELRQQKRQLKHQVNEYDCRIDDTLPRGAISLQQTCSRLSDF